jgi:hypothetical protein
LVHDQFEAVREKGIPHPYPIPISISVISGESAVTSVLVLSYRGGTGYLDKKGNLKATFMP